MQSRKPYPTDLHKTEWQILAPLIPAAKPGRRPEEYPKGNCQCDPLCPTYRLCVAVCPQRFAAVGHCLSLLVVLA
jgi:hypothetical protein